MSELTTQLPERLNNTEETGLDAVLSIPLLRLIVEGGPVTVEQFAAAAGRPVDDVRTGLAAVPDTEYDDQGRIIGQGLTLRPTPHRFTVAGEELGLIGAGFLILLIGVVVWRALAIAAASEDMFGRVAAAGIACWFGFQAPSISFTNRSETL